MANNSFNVIIFITVPQNDSSSSHFPNATDISETALIIVKLRMYYTCSKTSIMYYNKESV